MQKLTRNTKHLNIKSLTYLGNPQSGWRISGGYWADTLRISAIWIADFRRLGLCCIEDVNCGFMHENPRSVGYPEDIYMERVFFVFIFFSGYPMYR